jgi:hypothetical protein
VPHIQSNVPIACPIHTIQFEATFECLVYLFDGYCHKLRVLTLLGSTLLYNMSTKQTQRVKKMVPRQQQNNSVTET